MQMTAVPEHASVPVQPLLPVHGAPMLPAPAAQPPQKFSAGAPQVTAFVPEHA